MAGMVPDPVDAGPADAPLPPDLPARLRAATRTLHAEAERSGLMAALLRGQVGRAAYCALLRNLHAIYAVLEPANDAALVDPALHRADALAQDLAHLHGPRWREQLALAAATQAYVERLQALVQGRSRALAAHAYVRYLGDLHGGQVLRGLVRRALGLDAPGAATAVDPAAPGTRFYDFGDAARVRALRAAFRQRLAALPLGADEQQAVVDEACWAFVQHRRIFEQLQPSA
ncbi:MAG: biliverdin-producing heme oxygenase [Rubrivivax sp.]|nr:biliverdin-producing heme oxygenase [Rubrivivax sp.]